MGFYLKSKISQNKEILRLFCKYLEASKGLDEILKENGYVRQKDGNYKVIKENSKY